MLEESPARLVGPLGELTQPLRCGVLRLAGKHEEHHSKDRIFIAVRSRARSNLRSQSIVELP